MAHVIKNRDDNIGYYTGVGWDAEEGNAIRYATEEFAQNIITRHNMNADVVEVKDTDTDSHSSKRKK